MRLTSLASSCLISATEACQAPLGHIRGDPQRRVDAHVGADQQLFELFEHLVIQSGAPRAARRRAHETAQRPGLAGAASAGVCPAPGRRVSSFGAGRSPRELPPWPGQAQDQRRVVPARVWGPAGLSRFRLRFRRRLRLGLWERLGFGAGSGAGVGLPPPALPPALGRCPPAYRASRQRPRRLSITASTGPAASASPPCLTIALQPSSSLTRI